MNTLTKAHIHFHLFKYMVEYYGIETEKHIITKLDIYFFDFFLSICCNTVEQMKRIVIVESRIHRTSNYILY